MTIESLMNSFTQYISWLYYQREWAKWELQAIALTVLVLLLLILIQRRKARSRKVHIMQIAEPPSTTGVNLGSSNQVTRGFESNTNSHSIVTNSKNDASQNRWKETTKKWKNLQKTIEQLQQEIVQYKQAEEHLEQQFAKLKAANEKLRQIITGSNQFSQKPELDRPQTIDSFSKQKGKFLNTSEVLTEDS
jgi:septal ring factor EnvC (AmiA/AmiB activator)